MTGWSSSASGSGDRATVLVIGESLIDIVRRNGAPPTEIVGGSPANVALGLGRMGDAPRLLTALGSDLHGRTVADHLSRSGVVIDPQSWSLDRTSTATATIRDGAAQYEFDIEWKLPTRIELGAARIVHIGSISAFLPPGAASITAFLKDSAGRALVTFDPNIRPGLVGSHTAALDRVMDLAAHAHIVKLSDEDAAWLWPSASPDVVLDLLLDTGASLVALTLGGSGAIAATKGIRVRVAAPSVTVVDTVGAGDTFMAALLHHAIEDPSLIDSTDKSQLTTAVEFAVSAASLTVQRAGADLPTGQEIARAHNTGRSQRPETEEPSLDNRIALHATFTALPGKADDVATLLAKYAELVREEPGNLLFEAHQHSDEPERFFVYETYLDETAFHEHLGHTAGHEFNTRLSPLIMEQTSKLTLLQPLRRTR